MRLGLVALLVSQLAVTQKTFSLPMSGGVHSALSDDLTSGDQAAAAKSLPKEGGGSGGRSSLPMEHTPFHRRSPTPLPSPLPPPMEHQMHTKEKHRILASSGGTFALKEMKYGVVGSGQTVYSGFKQAHSNANRAVGHFKQGEKVKGVKHATIATGKAAGGILMSPVPIVTGLASGAVMGTYALKHKIQAAKAPKERLSREDPKDVHNLAKAFKEQKPVYNWTQKMVHKVLRTNSSSSKSKNKDSRVTPVAEETTTKSSSSSSSPSSSPSRSSNAQNEEQTNVASEGVKKDSFDRSPIKLPTFPFKRYQRKPGPLEPLNELESESWIDPKGMPQDKEKNYIKSKSFHM